MVVIALSLSNIEQTELENLHSIRPDPNIGTIHNRLRGVNRSSLGAGLLAQDLPKISNKPATNSGSLGAPWYSPEPKRHKRRQICSRCKSFLSSLGWLCLWPRRPQHAHTCRPATECKSIACPLLPQLRLGS